MSIIDKLKPVKLQDIDRSETREFEADPNAFQPSDEDVKMAEEWW